MDARKSIWILEDDGGSRFVYQEILGSRYHLSFFESISALRSGLSVRKSEAFDLLIADLKLPDQTFLEFLDSSGIDKKRISPFLVVSSHDDIELLRDCFSKGAVDYLTKPYGRAELLYKVEKVLSRRDRSSEIEEELAVDSTSLTVRRGGAQSEPLTSKEFQIISALCQAPQRAMSREDLIFAVWGGVTVTPKAFDVHLFNLRKKVKSLGVEIVYCSPNQYGLEFKQSGE